MGDDDLKGDGGRRRAEWRRAEGGSVKGVKSVKSGKSGKSVKSVKEGRKVLGNGGESTTDS